MSMKSKDEMERSSEKLSGDEGQGILGTSSKLLLCADEETRTVNSQQKSHVLCDKNMFWFCCAKPRFCSLPKDGRGWHVYQSVQSAMSWLEIILIASIVFYLLQIITGKKLNDLKHDCMFIFLSKNLVISVSIHVHKWELLSDSEIEKDARKSERAVVSFKHWIFV